MRVPMHVEQAWEAGKREMAERRQREAAEARDLAVNPFLLATATTPRPTAATHPGTDRDGLAKLQAQWDAAKAWEDENARLRAEHRRRQDEDAAEQRCVADGLFVDQQRRPYLEADPAATEEQFRADLPEIRRRHRIAAALAGNGGTRP